MSTRLSTGTGHSGNKNGIICDEPEEIVEEKNANLYGRRFATCAA